MPRGDAAYDAVILHSTTTVIRPDNAVKTMVVNAEYDAYAEPGDRLERFRGNVHQSSQSIDKVRGVYGPRLKG